MEIGIIILIIVVLLILLGAGGLAYFIYNPPKQIQSTSAQNSYVDAYNAEKELSNASEKADAKSARALVDAQTAAATIAPRQKIINLGRADQPDALIRGWMDVTKQGANNDYCAYIGSASIPANWQCSLAGGKGYTPASEIGSPANRAKENPYKNRAIKSQYTGRCIDAPNTDNTFLQMYDCNNTVAQQWTYNDETKSLKNTESNRCIDVSGDNRIQQYDCNDSKAQQWTYGDDNQIQSGTGIDMCLNISRDAYGNNESLILSKCNSKQVNMHFAWV